MSMNTIPFDPAKHLDIAAKLLVDRHARDRARDPRLPEAFDENACRAQIEHAFETTGWRGMIARSGDGEIAGFMIMAPQLTEPTNMLASFFPPRGVSLAYSSHAARAGSEYDAYREMFAALAEHFVSVGLFDFGANVSASDSALLETFSTLGFGRTMACAIRDVAPVARSAAPVDVHQASSEDIDVIHQLSDELTLHHARSPIFNPFMREADLAGIEFQKGLLTEPAANAHWVAYEDGKAIGMNTFMKPFFLAPMTVPEKTVYLFQGIVTQDARAGGVGSAILAKGVEWAREQGYENIALHYATANVPGAKFWQSSNFKPIDVGLRRRVDDRIAWANK